MPPRTSQLSPMLVSPFADPGIQSRLIDADSEQWKELPPVPNVFREWIPSTPPLHPDLQIQGAGERDSMGRCWNEFPVSALTNSFVPPSPMAMASPGPPPFLGEFKSSPLKDEVTVAGSGSGPATPTAPFYKGKGRAQDTLYAAEDDAYGGI